MKKSKNRNLNFCTNGVVTWMKTGTNLFGSLLYFGLVFTDCGVQPLYTALHLRVLFLDNFL